MNCTAFVVARDDLNNSKIIETQLPEPANLPDDALLVKVERFAHYTLSGRIPPDQGHMLSLLG
jgi:hypothetical protein